MDNEYIIELYNEKTNESSEATISFEVSVEPTEYEGSYVFYQGGAVMDDCSVEPFEFNGNTWEELPAMLFPYMIFNERWFKSRAKDIILTKSILLDDTLTETDKGDAIKEASGYIEDYVNWAFEEFVAPDVSVPKHYYPYAR